MNYNAEYIHEMVERLNIYRHEYYNENSPTQTVGYKAVSALEKITHEIPLLSLDKTKSIKDLHAFLKGELVTHNISAFRNVPLTIPYKNHLVITGEGFIHKSTFERLKDTLAGSDGKPYRNARNLASGSIRCLDANVCKERGISFYAFNVLEGFDEFDEDDEFFNIKNSRNGNLLTAKALGFGICPYVMIAPDITEEQLEVQINILKELAEQLDIPIDGMVVRFDNLEYSRSLGRSGEIAPVAVFDTIEIDGCEVSRASLHNISFIKNLELHPGCRILVSKRNMIIPHVEDNMERGHYQDMIPKTCPCCGKQTRIHSRLNEKKQLVETLHCDNPTCADRILKQFVHYSEKKAMNIKGLSEATLAKLIELGYLKKYHDLYHLDRYKDEIIALEGFGTKSFENLQKSIS